ncbi:LUD domain-containing protein [Desulfobaculum bizertense]|uniref:L-lactate dehydrogenase (quinone) large subunit LdhH n=1 Tax=Desulfobaculum bizertense TaxID=376490 RepID=UPI001F180ABF|nr:LUD domain-containing protein [Desulfobaculum bizertense]UIJ37862.1 LUD domain-containing protein [Desulfobaculum bizertense]
MQDAKNLSDYRKSCQEALDDEFLRKAIDKFFVAYRANRVNAFADTNEKELISKIADAKDAAIHRLPELYEEFKTKAEALGVHVHLAKTAAEANNIIAQIARDNDVKKIVKSKSMTAEETRLNHVLENEFEVVETDLGEWIIQMRHEGPSHMVMPAIHLSRYQVRDLFTDVTGKEQDSDIQKLVKVARRELRRHFVEADMGISGANFAIAETGAIGLVTNEGNARLVTTLPRVHVAICGVDKLTPTMHDALRVLKALPRNATGQALTSYITWIAGANECAVTTDSKKEMHIVFLDNGRLAMAQDPDFSQVLRCVRCGACANVCPVYRLVGGHKMGHIYIGAIGLILTYFFHGRDKAKNLVQNCINCGACKEVCAAGIDLPRLIKEIQCRILEEEGHPLYSELLGKLMKNRRLFHSLLKTARYGQAPMKAKNGFLRHPPLAFFKDHNFRALPQVADKPFRDIWKKLDSKVDAPKMKVGLFAGCVQDFVYPEQMAAAVKVLKHGQAAMGFPEGQSCCGLPLQMMGEKKHAAELAAQNIAAFDASNYDYVITLCASCASHMKHMYPRLLADDPSFALKAQQFADRVIDFSSFVRDVLKLDESDFKTISTTEKTAYHAPCHMCRGLGVKGCTQEGLQKAGVDYVKIKEEDVCCGFGGTFTAKFPAESQALMNKKLDHVKEVGATQLVTDCPGCVMQLRGGAEKRKDGIRVRHYAEVLAEQLKD